jgi:dienelactone hydrolase
VQPPQGSLTRRRRSLAGRTAGLVIAAGLVAGGVATAAPAQAASPYERGPAPTRAALERNGPYAVDQYAAQSPRGFPSGTVYAPRSTETFGAVAIVPGFVSSWSQLSWMGPRLASHGFVVIGINTNSAFDGPSERATQVWAGLQNILGDSRVNARIDRSRLALAGWSMGGGGSLEAARSHPEVKAVVPLAPWDLVNKNFSGVRSPVMIIGGESDVVAPNAEHSVPFYTSAGSSEKAFVNINDGSHFFPTGDNAIQSRMMVSWLKRHVDDDTRYTQFLCPGPSAGALGEVQEYRSTCPM